MRLSLTVAPSGWAERLILACAGSAGILYGCIMPALVDALQAGLGFSAVEAGRVSALNAYGGAFGSFCIAFVAPRVPAKASLLLLTSALALLDGASLWVASPLGMMAIRFAHGIFGGAVVGMAYLAISRLDAASRTFGIMVTLQYGAYMASAALLPGFVRSFGIAALFLPLVAFSAVTVALVVMLPVRAAAGDSRRPSGAGETGARMRLTLLQGLFALLLFQTGANAVNPYGVDLGQRAGLALDTVLHAISLSGFAGLIGGAIVATLPQRFGLRGAVSVSVGVGILGTLALLDAGDARIWLASNLLFGLAWGASVPLLLGVIATLDEGGASVVWASFMSKLGLASGPMLGSFVIGAPPVYGTLILAGAALLLLSLFAALSPSSMAIRIRAAEAKRSAGATLN